MSRDSRYGEECPNGHGWYLFDDGCDAAGCENGTVPAVDAKHYWRMGGGSRCGAVVQEPKRPLVLSENVVFYLTEVTCSRCFELAIRDFSQPNNDNMLLWLTPYQAANLLWFLKRVWYYGPEQIAAPNSGDWQGEIPQLLEKLMKRHGGQFVEYKANGGGDPMENPTWVQEPKQPGRYEWKKKP